MDFQTVYQFITKKELPNHFATVCDEKDEEFRSDSPNAVCFRFQEYDDAAAEAILAQAKEWQIKVHYLEAWDPEFHPGGKRIEEDSYSGIAPDEILVADGAFAGAVYYEEYSTGDYRMRCVLTSDYCGEPIFYRRMSWYGSSDMDVYYRKTLYLVKK